MEAELTEAEVRKLFARVAVLEAIVKESTEAIKYSGYEEHLKKLEGT